MADEKGVGEGEKKEANAIAAGNGKKKRKGIISRIWSRIFRLHGDDFEKRLQYISKEEAAALARLKRRSQTWRRIARHLIIFSVIFEVIAIGYAIMTTRSVDMNWKMRGFRVLPIFLLPALATLAYSALLRFTRMCDRRDHKTLERLRAERQAKIDELKEKTNYYTTQHLIQRYDPDPAAKAAAATVLASKLGADSGLKVYVGDESNLNAPTGRSNDVDLVPASGVLRNRKQVNLKSSSSGVPSVIHPDQDIHGPEGTGGSHSSEHNQLVDHYQTQGSTTHDGGWIARIAALLVGDDPAHSYALICSNCHMHNGLARKEDLPYTTYYCRHCHALNKSKQLEERVSGSNSLNKGSVGTGGGSGAVSNVSDSASENILPTNMLSAGREIEELTERTVSGDS